MGDHRILLSIKAEFHSKVYEIKDAWWNYCGYDGVDGRVVENMWEDGMARWRVAQYEAEAEQRAAETEAKERGELARLKVKYEETGDA